MTYFEFWTIVDLTHAVNHPSKNPIDNQKTFYLALCLQPGFQLPAHADALSDLPYVRERTEAKQLLSVSEGRANTWQGVELLAQGSRQ